MAEGIAEADYGVCPRCGGGNTFYIDEAELVWEENGYTSHGRCADCGCEYTEHFAYEHTTILKEG